MQFKLTVHFGKNTYLVQADTWEGLERELRKRVAEEAELAAIKAKELRDLHAALYNAV